MSSPTIAALVMSKSVPTMPLMNPMTPARITRTREHLQRCEYDREKDAKSNDVPYHLADRGASGKFYITYFADTTYRREIRNEPDTAGREERDELREYSVQQFRNSGERREERGPGSSEGEHAVGE